MTREERIAKLGELRANAESLAIKYNEAMTAEKFDDAVKIDAELSNIVNEYTGTARDICFDDCKATENPMIEAVTRLTFQTIAIRDEKKDEDAIPVRSIEEKSKPIDLLKLNKHCGGIGADDKWVHIAQKMNFLLTAQKAVDLGIDPMAINDSYDMSAIAHEFDMGKNPTSKTNLLRSLQRVVTAMLGDGYKATSHDVNFLLSVYSKKGRKALSVNCANHQYFVRYLAEICHRIVTGKVYEVEFKQKRG